MRRAMRRKAQQLTREQTEAILKENTVGVLSVNGEDGYPYAVPMNYWYENGKLWFHCAVEGYKLDCLRRNDKVSFCVIGQNTFIPEKFITHYTSVIAFGRARIVTESHKVACALRAFAKRFCPEPALAESLEKEVEGTRGRVFMLCVEIEHMTGKAAIELVNLVD